MKDTRTVLIANCELQNEFAIRIQQLAMRQTVLAGWDATWQNDRFLAHFRLPERRKAAPGPNGRQSNKAQLLGQQQTTTQFVVVGCPKLA
jgi:hypothetical protein